MLLFKNNWLVTTFILLFTANIAYGDELEYQNRGDRWEGIKAKPVSGKDIELLSALAYHGEKWQTIPSQCKLKFYLPNQKDVKLKVQELKPKYYYWLDQVIPKPRSWQSGFNEFQWATKDVIKPLKLDITKLGVVVSLGKSAKYERVAPAVFYHSELPKKIKGYLFHFKVCESSKLKYSIYKAGKKLLTKNLGKRFPGKPFGIFWDSSKAEEGEYELRVQGYFLDNFVPFQHSSILFRHKVIR